MHVYLVGFSHPALNDALGKTSDICGCGRGGGVGDGPAGPGEARLVCVAGCMVRRQSDRLDWLSGLIGWIDRRPFNRLDYLIRSPTLARRLRDAAGARPGSVRDRGATPPRLQVAVRKRGWGVGARLPRPAAGGGLGWPGRPAQGAGDPRRATPPSESRAQARRIAGPAHCRRRFVRGFGLR
jgi:hypothetical protein